MTIKKKLSTLIARAFLIAATGLACVAATASAQIFYVTSGPQGTINRFSTDGTNLGNLVSWSGANVQGIAVDNGGTIFAGRTQSGVNTIQQVSYSGVATTYATLTRAAMGLEFSNSGSLYGVQQGGGASGGNDVGMFTASGFVPLTLTGTPFAPFYSAQSVRFDSLGNLYVVNSGAGGVYANSIVKLTPSGGSWTASLFASTSGFSAFDIAFDSLNNAYVSSGSTGAAVTIRKYSSAGVLDSSFAVSGGSLVTPRGLEFANGYLYEADYGSNRVNQIDPSTGAASVFGIPTNINLTYIAYSPVPEPSQLALLGLGLGVVTVLTIRRKRQLSA